MYSKTIQKLVTLFSNFPTIGPRTAARFVFYLLKLEKEEIENLISAILELKKTIKICKSCFSTFEPPKIVLEKTDLEFCLICQDKKRDKSVLCLVEKETDLISIEKTKKYKGLYFILEEGEKSKIETLLRKIRDLKELKEIIIAFNPTSKGETAGLYLERLLKKNLPTFSGQITRLGRGLPIGAELEYADEETLSSALESRR